MPNTTIFSAIVPAPFGAIGVRTADALLQELVYLPPSHKPQDPADALAERAAGQIQRYFAEPDFRFDLPLADVGTGFQQRVWSAIASIPRGHVRTYGDLARLLTLLISDVPGDNPMDIASGPTVADPTTRADALAILARYRIHDAVSDLDAGYDGSLADLATRYGWFDQAHFTREFTELVGVPPGAYQRS